MGVSRVIVSFKVYRRPFRVPVRTSRGAWEAREGILLRVEDGEGRIGFGEVAPLEAFGSETLAGALAWIASLNGRGERARVEAVPHGMPCCGSAVGAALGGMDGVVEGGATTSLPVAALLPGGPGALDALSRAADRGFTVFKLKIGATDFASERALLEQLCERLPPKAAFRLDANGGLDVRAAVRWLDAAQAWPVEFIEQPLPVDAERDLIGLAGDHAVAVALDESVRSADDIKRWRDMGWAGVFVIKPALVGDPQALRTEVAVAPGQFVFSSALETDVGTQAGVRLAFAAGLTRALGYGVGAFFPDDGLGGSLDAPICTAETLTALDLSALWNRL